MNVCEVIQNLTIGVVSGIFSGVMVSLVFYILGEYQNELENAKEIIKPLNEVIILEKIISKDVVKSNEEIMQIIRADIDEVAMNLNPSIYKYSLRPIMFGISEIITNGQYYKREGRELIFDESKLHDFSLTMKSKLDSLARYENNFRRGFTERIIKNKYMMIMVCIVIVMIALVIIA